MSYVERKVPVPFSARVSYGFCGKDDCVEFFHDEHSALNFLEVVLEYETYYGVRVETWEVGRPVIAEARMD